MHDTHLPVRPRVIGYRKDGRPIYLIAGASETPPEPPGTDPAAQPPVPPPAVPPAQPPATGQEPPAQPPANPDELPTWAQRELKKLRDEAASNRVKAKEATDAATAAVEKMRQEQEAQRQALGKAFGFVGDEPPTAEELARQLADSQTSTQAAQAAARQASVELAVFRAAGTLGANGSALLDSRSFTSAIAGLDPSAPDFGQQVATAISAAMEEHPQYKVTPPAPAEPPRPAPPVPQSSPGQFTGANNGPRQWTQEDVDRATPAQVQVAINQGLLENLGFGPKRASRR